MTSLSVARTRSPARISPQLRTPGPILHAGSETPRTLRVTVRAAGSTDSTLAESATRWTVIPSSTTPGPRCGRTLAEGATQHPERNTATPAITLARRYERYEKCTCVGKRGSTSTLWATASIYQSPKPAIRGTPSGLISIRGRKSAYRRNPALRSARSYARRAAAPAAVRGSTSAPRSPERRGPRRHAA